MTGIRIKIAGPDDIPEIVRLNTILFQEDAGRRDPFTNVNWPKEHGDEHFHHHITADCNHCIVAESRGRVLGYLAGYLNDPTEIRPVKSAEIESMCVEPEYRNDGVGTELAAEFLEWAGNNGATRVSVSTFVANEGAIRFYERLGFEPRMLSLERSIS